MPTDEPYILEYVETEVDASLNPKELVNKKSTLLLPDQVQENVTINEQEQENVNFKYFLIHLIITYRLLFFFLGV